VQRSPAYRFVAAQQVRNIPPRFRTIQLCPKDLPVFLRQVHFAVD
jgi:hypothetical protein